MPPLSPRTRRPTRGARLRAPLAAGLTLATAATLVVAPPAATAEAATGDGITAGAAAWVGVPVARLWETPRSPLAVDRPVTRANPDIRGWLAALTFDQRKGLFSRSDTEALLGERVVVVATTRRWARVVVPDQPSQKDPRGYPGWIPRRQLVEQPPADAARQVTVTAPTTWVHHRRDTDRRLFEISAGTVLPLVRGGAEVVRVRLPRGGVRALDRADVQVHRPGRAALPRDRGLLGTARDYLGLDYLWGGLSGFGIDCSGLTWLSYRLHGRTIPRDALPQSGAGRSVARADLRPGDLIFYATDGLVHHVTMKARGGRMIEAPATGEVVRISPVRTREYHPARRYTAR